MSNPKDLVGAKKAPLRYVPAALVIEASGPMEDGAIKYGPFNWRDIPVELMTYIEAVQRHLAAFVDGQDNAEDSGHSHIGHAIAGLGIIADAKANGTLIDNRPTKGPAADMLRERDKSVPKSDSIGAAVRSMMKENPNLFTQDQHRANAEYLDSVKARVQAEIRPERDVPHCLECCDSTGGGACYECPTPNAHS